MDFPISVPSIGLVDGKFADEDPLLGTPGSLIPAQWGNAVTAEILNVIEAAGLTSDEFDNAQLLAALQLLVPGSVPNATELVAGKARIATQVQTTAGADDATLITPLKLAQRLATLSGRLVRTSAYTLVGGVQMVSVDGGAFTAAGATTFTKHPLAAKQTEELVGGGGGSGSTTATSASQWSATGGGAGGSYGFGLHDSPASPVAVTIGAGGLAGVAGGNGGNGGTTSLGSLISVNGGPGSAGMGAGSGYGVVGGASPTKTVSGANIHSSIGGYGSYAISLTQFIGGTGGSSVFGPGGAPALGLNVGLAALSPGAGAGGSVTGPSGAAQVGAKGGDGLLIVREYT